VAFLALAGAVGALAANLDPQGRRLALVAAAGLVGVAATPIGQPASSVSPRSTPSVALPSTRASWGIARDVATRAVVQIGAGVLLGLPFAGALCYEFLELTGSGRSVPGAVAMASVLGVSVMLLVSLTACTVPTLRALRIAPMDALRKEG
jgi:hypothetical protein